MSYSYDAGISTPGYAGLIEISSVIRLNSSLLTGTEPAGGTFKLTDNPFASTPPPRVTLDEYPNDWGSYPGPQYYDAWPFTISGWLWVPSGPDDVAAAQEQLKAAFAARNGQMTLVTNMRGWATRRQIVAQTNGQITFSPRHGRLAVPTRDFVIPMVAADPILYDADNAKTADVPMDGSTVVTVTNNGDTDVPFVARFIGPWTNQAILTCTSNGQVITYGAPPTNPGTAITGAYIDVDTHPYARTVLTNAGANNFSRMSTWTLFTIPPGSSTFTASASSGTSGASKVTLMWRDGWT